MDNDILLNEIKRTFDDEINALKDAELKINDNYIKAVKLISKANKIIFSGVGKSGIIAKKIAATFSSIGKASIFLHPVEALHGDIGIIQKSDIVILLSKSGGTEELVKLMPYLKMRSAKIIAIVGNLNSFLANHSDIVLDASVKKEACPHNLAPTSSSTLALVIGDSLAVAVMKEINVSVESFSRLHPLGQIGRNISVKIKDIMHKFENLPIIKKDDLLLNAIIEMTDKSLGCVCVTDNENKLCGLITDGDLRRALQKYPDLRELTVDLIMTRKPICCNENDLLGDVLALMEQRPNQLSVMPVIDKKNVLKGVVRIHDIIRSGV